MNKAVFWDFHGTLIYPDKLWSRSIHRAIISLWPDRSLTLEQVAACQGTGIFPWDHPERDYRHLMDPACWWAFMDEKFQGICRCCGLDEAETRRVVPLIRGLILEAGNFRLYEDALPTLRQLKADGWRNFILSNNFPDLPGLCQALGIDGHFEDIIVSALVGYEKPRGEIFDLARQRAGFPELCVMVGDNLVADIGGACAAGMKGVLVHPRAPRQNAIAESHANVPTHVCSNLVELPDLLRSPAFTTATHAPVWGDDETER